MKTQAVTLRRIGEHCHLLGELCSYRLIPGSDSCLQTPNSPHNPLSLTFFIIIVFSICICIFIVFYLSSSFSCICSPTLHQFGLQSFRLPLQKIMSKYFALVKFAILFPRLLLLTDTNAFRIKISQLRSRKREHS